MKASFFKASAVTAVLAVAVLVATSDAALAGTGGTEFDDIWLTLTDWVQGTLGRVVSGAMVMVGIIGGVARQSLMGLGMGVGAGLGLYNTPTVVESIMTATLPVAEKAASVAHVAGTMVP